MFCNTSVDFDKKNYKIEFLFVYNFFLTKYLPYFVSKFNLR